MEIKIRFTGICAFVPTDDDSIFVILPNERNPVISSHGQPPHLHTAPHLPHIVYRDQEGLTKSNAFNILFSFTLKGVPYNVIALNDSSGVGRALAIQGEPLPNTLIERLGKIVDMRRVVGSSQARIDPALVDRKHDPIGSRVAARIEIGFGVVESTFPEDAKGKLTLSQFRPKPDSGTYQDTFPQEVTWTVALKGERYYLMGRAFGSEEYKPILNFEGNRNFELMIGNTTFEDVLQTEIGRDEIVDYHFSTYYKLLEVEPAVRPLPHRSSTGTLEVRSGGGNCPPAKYTLGD